MTTPQTRQSFSSNLSDRDLLAELERAAAIERGATAHLIALLMEVDTRKLYAGQGCSSLFTYCVQILHLSEHAAYLRIEAARLARRFPAILDRLARGSIHLTAISLLGPHLTDANHVELLNTSTHKSKRDVERLITNLRPQPDVPSVVRKLPAPACAPTSALTLWLPLCQVLMSVRQSPRRLLLPHRWLQSPQSSSRSPRNVTRYSSPSLTRRTKSCGACRI